MRRAQERSSDSAHVVRNAVQHVVDDGFIRNRRGSMSRRYGVQPQGAMRRRLRVRRACRGHGWQALRQRAQIPVPWQALWAHTRLRTHPEIGRSHRARSLPLPQACKAQAPPGAALPHTQTLGPRSDQQVIEAHYDGRHTSRRLRRYRRRCRRRHRSLRTASASDGGGSSHRNPSDHQNRVRFGS